VVAKGVVGALAVVVAVALLGIGAITLVLAADTRDQTKKTQNLVAATRVQAEQA
jgi:hypothetical protein